MAIGERHRHLIQEVCDGGNIGHLQPVTRRQFSALEQLKANRRGRPRKHRLRPRRREIQHRRSRGLQGVNPVAIPGPGKQLVSIR